MKIDFDPAKDRANVAKHGLSLADFVGFDADPVTVIDDRFDYGEVRYQAFGRVAGQGHCLVFTVRGKNMRLISYRRARDKEMRRYDRKVPPPADFDENPEWTDAEFARARPASEVFGQDVMAALVRGRGRPAKAKGERKQPVNLRLSPDVLAALKATGAGWQTRVDEALRKTFVKP